MIAWDRLMRNVEIDPATGCWLRGGVPNSKGYVAIKADGERHYAHRLSYMLHVGPIPEGHQIDHVYAWGCRHRNCINPAHLEAVTGAENNRRSVSPSAVNARKDVCPQGHSYGESNTYVYRGRRYCRACQRDHKRRYRRMARLAAA